MYNNENEFVKGLSMVCRLSIASFSFTIFRWVFSVHVDIIIHKYIKYMVQFIGTSVSMYMTMILIIVIQLKNTLEIEEYFACNLLV